MDIYELSNPVSPTVAAADVAAAGVALLMAISVEDDHDDTACISMDEASDTDTLLDEPSIGHIELTAGDYSDNDDNNDHDEDTEAKLENNIVVSVIVCPECNEQLSVDGLTSERECLCSAILLSFPASSGACYRVGQKVLFPSKNGFTYPGTIIRFDSNTVAVMRHDEAPWNHSTYDIARSVDALTIPGESSELGRRLRDRAPKSESVLPRTGRDGCSSSSSKSKGWKQPAELRNSLRNAGTINNRATSRLTGDIYGAADQNGLVMGVRENMRRGNSGVESGTDDETLERQRAAYNEYKKMFKAGDRVADLSTAMHHDVNAHIRRYNRNRKMSRADAQQTQRRDNDVDSESDTDEETVERQRKAAADYKKMNANEGTTMADLSPGMRHDVQAHFKRKSREKKSPAQHLNTKQTVDSRSGRDASRNPTGVNYQDSYSSTKRRYSNRHNMDSDNNSDADEETKVRQHLAHNQYLSMYNKKNTHMADLPSDMYEDINARRRRMKKEKKTQTPLSQPQRKQLAKKASSNSIHSSDVKALGGKHALIGSQVTNTSSSIWYDSRHTTNADSDSDTDEEIVAQQHAAFNQFQSMYKNEGITMDDVPMKVRDDINAHKRRRYKNKRNLQIEQSQTQRKKLTKRGRYSNRNPSAGRGPDEETVARQRMTYTEYQCKYRHEGTRMADLSPASHDDVNSHRRKSVRAKNKTVAQPQDINYSGTDTDDETLERQRKAYNQYKNMNHAEGAVMADLSPEIRCDIQAHVRRKRKAHNEYNNWGNISSDSDSNTDDETKARQHSAYKQYRIMYVHEGTTMEDLPIKVRDDVQAHTRRKRKEVTSRHQINVERQRPIKNTTQKITNSFRTSSCRDSNKRSIPGQKVGSSLGRTPHQFDSSGADWRVGKDGSQNAIGVASDTDDEVVERQRAAYNECRRMHRHEGIKRSDLSPAMHYDVNAHIRRYNCNRKMSRADVQKTQRRDDSISDTDEETVERQRKAAADYKKMNANEGTTMADLSPGMRSDIQAHLRRGRKRRKRCALNSPQRKRQRMMETVVMHGGNSSKPAEQEVVVGRRNSLRSIGIGEDRDTSTDNNKSDNSSNKNSGVFDSIHVDVVTRCNEAYNSTRNSINCSSRSSSRSSNNAYTR